MAHRIGDRVLVTVTATIGTGNLTVAATTSGYQSLDALCTVNADTIDVAIVKGTQWEYVRLTRVSAGVYSRAATPFSSSTGSQINFTAGTAEVFGDVGAFFAEHLNTVEIAVASATTCDIGAVKGLRVEITGTTTITSFGTSPNKLRFVRFSGALTLTHFTPLILPGAANIITVAGDTAIFASDASGNWRCLQYQRASRSWFIAFNSATDSNVTGNGETVTIDFDTELVDRGSNFASDTFTAVVTDPHAFSGTVGLSGLVSGNVIDFRLVTSNRSYSLYYGTAAAQTGGDLNLNFSVAAADMDVGDTAHVTVTVSGGGTTVDIFGTAGMNTHFCGKLA